MKTKTGFPKTWWIALCLALLTLPTVLRAEVTFESLEVGLDTYRNVKVTTLTDNDIYIEHSKGFANIKVVDLPVEVQERLGYATKATKKTSSNSGAGASAAAVLETIPIDPKYTEAKDQMMTQMQLQMDTVGKNILFAVIAVAILGYFFSCYCLRLICLKSGTKPGFLIWLPILQAFPMLRAARMSGWWFLAWLLPAFAPLLAIPLMPYLGEQNLWMLLLPNVLSLVAGILWCFKICSARGVSPIFGIMLLLPLLNIIAFFYLAFGPANGSSGGAASDPDYHSNREQDTSFFYQT